MLYLRPQLLVPGTSTPSVPKYLQIWQVQMFGTSLTGRNDRLNLPCIMHQSNGFAQIPDAEVHYRYSLAREYRLRVTFRCGIQEHSSWNIVLLGITHFTGTVVYSVNERVFLRLYDYRWRCPKHWPN